MRRRLFNCALLVALAASAAAARQSAHAWLRITPEGEEFVVHMPEPHFRIRRELPFGNGVTLKPVSYEITYRGGLFSVLSFPKSEPATPKTLRAFAEGFSHALGEGGVRAERLRVGEPGPDGGGTGELRLSSEGHKGTARVFETQRHFYVVLSLAGAEAAAAAAHFHDSFSFDRAGADRVPLKQPTESLRAPVTSPAPLWPVAGGMESVGVMVGERVPGDGRRPDVATAQADTSNFAAKTVISGGVLNHKALPNPPPPVYPPIAKAARAQGTVVVRILVDEEGYVISADAVSGHPLLQQSAVYAARQARFTPTRLGGQPVKVSGVVTYNFVLGESGPNPAPQSGGRPAQ